MSHYAALSSIVFMIAFVCLFDLRHKRNRIRRLIASVILMSAEELDQLRLIRLACEEA